MFIKLHWIWNKVVVACFELISLHLAEGNEENHEKPQSGWIVSEIRTGHKPETFPLKPSCSVYNIYNVSGFESRLTESVSIAVTL
jgi:hypothetical protein